MTQANPSSKPPRRAFSLVELILALALLGVVLDAGIELFNASAHATQESDLAADRISTMDSALWLLRQDVWAASQISVTDPQTVQLLSPGGATTLWRIDSAGSIHRTVGQAHQQWPSISKNWRFQSTSSSLIITDLSSPSPQGMQLVSQLLLAGTKS